MRRVSWREAQCGLVSSYILMYDEPSAITFTSQPNTVIHHQTRGYGWESATSCFAITQSRCCPSAVRHFVWTLVQVAVLVRGFVWYTLLRLLSGFSNENDRVSVAGISVSLCVCVCVSMGFAPVSAVLWYLSCSSIVCSLRCTPLAQGQPQRGSARFKVDQT